MNPATPVDAVASRSVSFGPFRLTASERLLERGGVRIAIGSRALDVLIFLVAHAGETVNKKVLTAGVWSGVEVSESVLRVHIANLRKVLADGREGTRYISNVAGQGYCFVAPVSLAQDASAAPASAPPAPHRVAAAWPFPPPLTSVIGREQVVGVLRARMLAQRFVTIVGPGGIGKTTVAIAVGHALREDFQGAACFVDLGRVREPEQAMAAIAAAFGFEAEGSRARTGPHSDLQDELLAFLQDKQALLILDNCEHVVEAVAPLAEQIFRQAPLMRILATSREALRVDGEKMYRLAMLSSPAGYAGLPADELRRLPAVQLFLEKSAAGGADLELSHADLAEVAALCERLDGIALAIEIAAGFAGEFGVGGAVDLVDDSFRMMRRQGRRTAPPRQVTLNALYDWSFGLLSDYERVTLRRLAIFTDSFDDEAAHAVVAARGARANVMHALSRLVAKSLLTAVVTDAGSIRYRMLETGRAFALEKLIDSGEQTLVAERLAQHVASLCDGRLANAEPRPGVAAASAARLAALVAAGAITRESV